MNVHDRREPQREGAPGFRSAAVIALSVVGVLVVAVGTPTAVSWLGVGSSDARVGSPSADQEGSSRRMAIGRDTAALLNHGADARAARGEQGSKVGERMEGQVLATTMTSKGEIILLGMAIDDGRRCVVQQYVRSVPGGNSGARCTDDGSTPFGSKTIDLSAAQELLDAGLGTVSVVMGGVPRNTATVVLQGGQGPERRARAYGGSAEWGPHSYFVAPWPIEPGAEVVALDENGNELAREPLDF